ncbi:LURP-one-related family protein [Salinicoccus sp. ID82-1]|nr:LURP-one-related family protein [Salinicoccus sp. ID82-1]
MRFYIKQKIFSFKNQFTVKDAEENDAFYVEGKAISLRNKLRVTDTSGEEVLYIEQKVLRFSPEFELYRNDQKVATVKKDFNLLANNYTILGPDWHIEGSIMEHNYFIKENDNIVAEVSKKLISWGDSYSIDIYDEAHLDILLGIVIVIDCVNQKNN